MKTFQGIDHEIQRLYLHWDITTKCNYNCNYCYAKLDYSSKNNWQKEIDVKIINNIITSISFSSLPVFLGLLGGEPTLSKNYFYILDKIQEKILFRKDRNRLYITTNLSKNLDWWKENPKLERTFILTSFHPEYHNEKTIKEFIEKLYYLDKFFKVKVNIMLDPNYKNITDLWNKYLKDIKRDTSIIIHPHIIYPDGSPFNDIQKIYSESLDIYEEIYSYQDPEYELIQNNKKDSLRDIDIFSRKLQSFKDWKCYQNNYEISFNGDVLNLCFNERDNLNKNIFFFKKIKEIKARKCFHDWCNCDGLLKCKKVKEG